jgi:hypothetical protein
MHSMVERMPVPSLPAAQQVQADLPPGCNLTEWQVEQVLASVVHLRPGLAPRGY